MKDNSYQNIYDKGYSVRRYPESDVIAFAAGLQEPRIILDVGTGTGRNLLPLLQYCLPSGLVIASDIAESGLASIANLMNALNCTQLCLKDLSSNEQRLIYSVYHDPSALTLFKIYRLQNCTQLGPLSIAKNTLDKNSILLCLDLNDMVKIKYLENSIDAVINRGNLMYLERANIKDVIDSMYEAVKAKGRCMMTLKSTADSRFFSSDAIKLTKYRRIQKNNGQEGLEMEFHEKKHILKLVEKFTIIKLNHLINEDMFTGKKLADWLIQVEKPY